MPPSGAWLTKTVTCSGNTDLSQTSHMASGVFYANMEYPAAMRFMHVCVAHLLLSNKLLPLTHGQFEQVGRSRRP
jgi:hypothetical protein